VIEQLLFPCLVISGHGCEEIIKYLRTGEGALISLGIVRVPMRASFSFFFPFFRVPKLITRE
jgi:hypothetical protein